MSIEMQRRSTLPNGEEVFVVGLAKHGETEEIDDNITQIGQDAALVLPEHSLIGVFDGASGALEAGPQAPARASRTAAAAIRRYFAGTTAPDLSEAMQFAREVVEDDEKSGVTMATIAQIRGDSVSIVTAGDTGAIVYDAREKKDSTLYGATSSFWNAN